MGRSGKKAIGEGSRFDLSNIETRVWEMIAQGLTDIAIAGELHYSYAGTAHLVARVYNKLHIDDLEGRCNMRVLAARLWLERKG